MRLLDITIALSSRLRSADQLGKDLDTIADDPVASVPEDRYIAPRDCSSAVARRSTISRSLPDVLFASPNPYYLKGPCGNLTLGIARRTPNAP
jgi:hypothetical protein